MRLITPSIVLADRVARIMTPYVPALVIVALLNLVVISNDYGAGKSDGILSFIGNLVLLQDHSGFQFLEMARVHLPFKIHPYNSAEPFWTVAVEMWIYVGVGLFFFCLVLGEKIDRSILLILAALSLPVIIWNAAAGGGKSLTLIWLVGGVFGFAFHLWNKSGYGNNLAIGALLSLIGSIALAGRVGKVGYDAYDLQTATLLALIMFGLFALLAQTKRAPRGLVFVANGFASYSYSLYLMHNTMLIIVLENLRSSSILIKVAVAFVLAHAASYLIYLLFERHYRAVSKWLRPLFERLFAYSVRPARPAVGTGAVEPAASSSPYSHS